ncbi:T-complex 11 [Gaertneriomyces semiglobifer]|nr:T-complex 11 [Gaertneriomyces semiglobifer]
MDPEFELKPAKRSQLEEQVRTVAKKAFFDQVKEEFSQGRFGAHVPVFIEEIRKTLLSMVAEHGKVAENIKESLDLELIKQQIDNNVFDITKCITYVTQKMLQLCAPVRDPHIRAIAQSPDYATAFERVLEVLEEMKIDLANYRLQSLRPVLQQQAVEYEKTKFNEALSSGEESLMKTEAWLSSAVQALANVSASRNPERIESPDHRVAYENAYNEALLSLVFSNMPVSLNSLPETLKMDAERLFGFQNEAQAIAIVAALVMLSRNTVPDLRDDSAALISLKDALLVLLRDEGTTVDNLSMQVISTLNQFLERKPGNGVKKLSVDQEGLLRSMVEKTLSYRDPVFSLISRRVQTCIRQQLEKGQFRRDSLPSQGLDVIQKELESLSLKICLLAKHNKQVYAEHYDRILAKLV